MSSGLVVGHLPLQQVQLILGLPLVDGGQPAAQGLHVRLGVILPYTSKKKKDGFNKKKALLTIISVLWLLKCD